MLDTNFVIFLKFVNNLRCYQAEDKINTFFAINLLSVWLIIFNINNINCFYIIILLQTIMYPNILNINDLYG